jgi:small-conductance mechanosensitive channel
VKRLFQLITLKSAVVSVHRKRQFVLTALLLVAVYIFRGFSLILISEIPFALKVFDVLTYTLIFNVLVNAFRIFIVSRHRQRREISNNEHDNFTVGVNALVNAATGFATVIFIFIVFDIQVRAFLSSIAIFAAALTIIFQDFIKNFLFGLSIMFAADYGIGDYIQVGTMPKGVILNITFSYVLLKTEKGDVLYVPNTVVHSNEITNFSKFKPRLIRVEFCLLRSQFSTVDTFTKRLLEYIDTTYPGTFDVEKSHVYVKESHVEEVIFTLEAYTKKASLKLKEQVNNSVQKFAVEFKG